MSDRESINEFLSHHEAQMRERLEEDKEFAEREAAARRRQRLEHLRWMEREGFLSKPWAPPVVVGGVVLGMLVLFPFVILFVRWWWTLILGA